MSDKKMTRILGILLAGLFQAEARTASSLAAASKPGAVHSARKKTREALLNGV